MVIKGSNQSLGKLILLYQTNKCRVSLSRAQNSQRRGFSGAVFIQPLFILMRAFRDVVIREEVLFVEGGKGLFDGGCCVPNLSV